MQRVEVSIRVTGEHGDTLLAASQTSPVFADMTLGGDVALEALREAIDAPAFGLRRHLRDIADALAKVEPQDGPQLSEAFQPRQLANGEWTEVPA